MALLASEVASSSSILNARDCALIQNFEETTSGSFAEFFANLAHQREICMDSRIEGCEVLLQKRINDFHIVVKGQKYFSSNESALAAEDAFAEMLGNMRRATGLRAVFDEPVGVSDYIWLVFVNVDTVKQDFDAYVKARIARKSFGHVQERTELFKFFINSNAPCEVVLNQRPDSIIKAAHIWIRSDLSPSQTKRCIAEEFYNSFGLDEGIEVGSIFDYKFSHRPSDTSLSEFDLLLLKVLYSNSLAPGSTRANTIVTVQRLASRECGFAQ